jgi:integrase
MALTDITIRKLKPFEKPNGEKTKNNYKVSDEKGLYIEVTPKGNKRWRFKYRIDGKEKLISLGVYPEVSLKAAREKRDEYRTLVADGIDPSELRKANKREEKGKDDFEFVAREWLDKQANTWSAGHYKKTLGRFENHIFPHIGHIHVDKITVQELLLVLTRIEKSGSIDTAHRMRQQCAQVFSYAIITRQSNNNPAEALKGSLTPHRVVHHASITDTKRVGQLMRDIDTYTGNVLTKFALKLSPLLFLRPIEIRSAEWHEFDLNAAEWRIPAEKMKKSRPHIVPLSTQALTIIEELYEITGHGRWLFPSQNNRRNSHEGACMSDGTVRGALRRLGYDKDEMSAHGFRSMASTLLNERGYNSDWIERQLAHVSGDKVRASYNYAQHLPERREMMQEWADYLTDLKTQVSN